MEKQLGFFYILASFVQLCLQTHIVFFALARTSSAYPPSLSFLFPPPLPTTLTHTHTHTLLYCKILFHDENHGLLFHTIYGKAFFIDTMGCCAPTTYCGVSSLHKIMGCCTPTTYCEVSSLHKIMGCCTPMTYCEVSSLH